MRDGDAVIDASGSKTRRGAGALRRFLLLIGPIAAVAGALYLYLQGGRYVSIDNAYVKADTVTVANDVAGMVASVSVTNNQIVAVGQELFRFDDEAFRITLASAEANLAQVRNDIEVTKASWRQKLEDLRTDELQIAFYDREFRRQQDLVSNNVVSRSQFDVARRNLDVARQQLASDRQQLAGITATLSGDPEIPAEKHPRFLAAQAQRDQAARDLRRVVVKAPIGGVVTNVDKLQPGQYLAAGAAAFSLVSSDHVWVEANPKETELTHVRAGHPVRVTIDAYPDVSWWGAVSSLSPASGAEFALLPAQNTSGNWVKVVQRIPIRVRIESTPDQPTLRAGMSAVAVIDTGRERSLKTLIASLIGE
jgi:membrane fusion protein (multidrug efflux system)